MARATLMLMAAITLACTPESEICKPYYWDVELLAEFPGEPAPPPHIDLPAHWLLRCEVNSTNDINGHGDVVTTLAPSVGTMEAVVNKGEIPLVANGTSIACGVSDDMYVSGALNGNGWFWKLSKERFGPSLLTVLPHSAMIGHSLLSGSKPFSHVIRQPGNIYTFLIGGTYRSSEGVKGLFGDFAPDIAQLSSGISSEAIVNGVVNREVDTYAVFGSHGSGAGYFPFVLETDGFKGVPSNPLGSESRKIGSVHDVNARNTAVGCVASAIDELPSTYGAFLARWKEATRELHELAPIDRFDADEFPGLNDAESCLHAINDAEFAGGTIREKEGGPPRSHGFIYSPITGGKATPISSEAQADGLVALSRLGTQPVHAYAIRGLDDSGRLAANVRIRESLYAARLTPVAEVAKLELVHPEPHPDPAQPPIVRPGEKAKLIWKQEVPATCGETSHEAKTYHYSDSGYRGSGTHELPSGLGVTEDLLALEIPTSVTPARITYGIEFAAQRAEVEFWYAESAETFCGDKKDNDLDGLVDCDDPDCLGKPALSTPSSGARPRKSACRTRERS